MFSSMYQVSIVHHCQLVAQSKRRKTMFQATLVTTRVTVKALRANTGRCVQNTFVKVMSTH